MDAQGGGAGVDTHEDLRVVRHTQAEALANVLAVLQLCGAGKLRCSEKTHRPAAATVAAVAEVLAGGDFYPAEPIAAFAWPLLIQAGGLAELAGSRLQLTATGRAAPGRPPAETVRALWRAWVGKAIIDELSRVEHIKGQRTANTLTSAKTRRKTVAAALTRCPAGEWVLVDDLFATMRRSSLSPTVARSDRALWRLYLSDPQYGSLGYAGFADWPILEGRYTLAVLFEYAGSLGLFDLDYAEPAGARDDFRTNWGTDDLDYLSRYDGLGAIRLNALGAYVLGLTDRYEPPRHRASGAADTQGTVQSGDRGHWGVAAGRQVDAGHVRGADRGPGLDTSRGDAADRIGRRTRPRPTTPLSRRPRHS